MDKSEVAVREIFSLYDKWGGDKYIGENVTQLQHAQQVTDTICSLSATNKT